MNPKIIRYKEVPDSERINSVLYWCNACGELHYHGEHDITEDDLPDELRRAYNDLWGENYGSLCYLVETAEGYGIALVNEYGDKYAKDCGLTMDELFNLVVKDAETVSKNPLFQNAEILAIEYSGFDEGHELIAIFPCDTELAIFSSAADALRMEMITARREGSGAETA